eukprot:362553_1
MNSLFLMLLSIIGTMVTYADNSRLLLGKCNNIACIALADACQGSTCDSCESVSYGERASGITGGQPCQECCGCGVCRCGGIAGFACPEDETCANCSPQGAADCMGVCQ